MRNADVAGHWWVEEVFKSGEFGKSPLCTMRFFLEINESLNGQINTCIHIYWPGYVNV